MSDIRQVRGNRVKQVRLMMGKSRKGVTESYGLPASTIQSWEDGKVGGLTLRGAKRIVAIAKSEGVIVTTEYLLDGTGYHPMYEDVYDRLILGQKALDVLSSFQEHEEEVTDEF